MLRPPMYTQDDGALAMDGYGNLTITIRDYDVSNFHPLRYRPHSSSASDFSTLKSIQFIRIIPFVVVDERIAKKIVFRLWG